MFFFLFPVDVFEKALNAGFIQATDYVEIWQSYLDYLRRRVDFSKGEKAATSDPPVAACRLAAVTEIEPFAAYSHALHACSHLHSRWLRPGRVHVA